MKLIEGMKHLRVIEKKMAHNAQRINEYAAIVSSERPIFGTEAQQRKEVEALIQANTDLAQDYLNLKKRVDLTNIQTRVTIGKQEYSISDLLQIKRLVGKWMRNTYGALNDKLAEQRMAAMRVQLQSAEKAPRIERMYDENKKYEGMQFWQGLEDEIETRIEVINATTELIEL
jgi:hypothetical protein